MNARCFASSSEHFSPSTPEHPHRRRLGWSMAASYCVAACCALILSGCGQSASTDKGPAHSASAPASGPGTTPAGSTGAGGGLPQVGFITLEATDATLDALLPGRAAASASAQVRPQVTGIVQQRLFREGAPVQRGQPLYHIDDAALRISLAAAEATLDKARTNAAATAQTLERNTALAATHSISEQALQDSRTAAAIARADLAAAQASRDMAALNLRHARVHAPLTGRIGTSSVSTGALVTANQSSALAEIVQTDPMHIDFTQSTAQLLAWKRAASAAQEPQKSKQPLDLPLEIILEDGSTHPHAARLVFDGLTAANPTTGSVTLRATVPNPHGQLVPGMFVQVRLPRGIIANALRVPQRAVTRELDASASVLVVVEKDGVQTLQKRSVQLGESLGADWLVLDGLSAGDKVVIDGFQKARAGSKVRAVPAQASAQRRPVDAAAERAALQKASASQGEK